MRSGTLRHLLVIQRATGERSSDGAVVPDWDTVGDPRAASIEVLGGRELFQAQQVQAEVTHRIRLRYVDGLTSAERLFQSSTGRTFNVLSVTNPDEKRLVTEVLAKVMPAEVPA